MCYWLTASLSILFCCDHGCDAFEGGIDGLSVRPISEQYRAAGILPLVSEHIMEPLQALYTSMYCRQLDR